MNAVGHLFRHGKVVITSGLVEELEATEGWQHELGKCLDRHVRGDWGELSKEDREANESALRYGSRLLSVYWVGTVKVWIITDAAWDEARPRERQTTTILRPEDY